MMTIIFEGVSVVPMDRERVAEGQSVMVEDDRITWIGPEAEARIPSGATRIDGRGMYLMPGLSDMHSHPCTEDDLLLLVAYGVTTIRCMEGMPRYLLWRDRIAAGELLGPTIHSTGPIVDGRPVRGNWSLSVVEPEEALAAVVHTERGRYEAVKVYDQLSVDAYTRVVGAAGDRGIPVVGHIPFQVGLHGALAAGQRSIEHLYGYPQALQPASRMATAPRDLAELRAGLFDLAQHAELERISELAEATREAGTWNCPTLIVRRRWIADPHALLARPEMRYLPPVRAAQGRYFVNKYPKDPARHAVCELNAALVRGLSAAGAGLLLGTDAGIPGVVYGASVHEELEAFVDAGLSPYQALRAATYGPAAYYGQTGEWGEVTVSARADLLLVEADPLADVRNASRIAGVMAGGRWLPQPEIAELLDGLVARQSEPLAHRPHSGSTSAVQPGSERLRFELTWDGWHSGVDDIVAEQQITGGRRILSTSSIESLGGSVAFDAGVYRASVSVDAAGIEEAAWFEYDGNDGLDRVEITRIDGQVRIRHGQAMAGESEVMVADPGPMAMFGPPLTALYVRLAERLTELEVDDEIEFRVIGPGLPPDLTVGEAALHATRLPATGPEDDDRRYAVEFRRPNADYAALMVCDNHDRPIRIDMSSDMGYWHRNATPGQSDAESYVKISRV